MDASGPIEGAYGIERVLAAIDEEGPYLIVDFPRGDYYSHDRTATCTVRVVGEELRIEYRE